MGETVWPAVRRSLRLRRTAILTVVVVGAALLVGPAWLPRIGGFLIAADPLRPADALVALGGEPGRAPYGARLFKQGYAGWYVITDPPLGVPCRYGSYAKMIWRQVIRLGVPADHVLIAPPQVTTTYEEALALRSLAQQRQWRSLIVVTSAYHTRRSRLIFADVFRDSGVAVIVRPVEGHWYRPEDWWQRREGLQVTLSEFLKLGLYFVGYR